MNDAGQLPADRAAIMLAGALEGVKTGFRSRKKSTVRKYASALGHTLGMFEARKHRNGSHMYNVAWCSLCGDAAFTGQYGSTNPALDRMCPRSR
jgi:hypothetical protein